MRHNVIRYSVIVMLIGLVALAAGRANAQSRDYIQLDSFSWGMCGGQFARISVAYLGDGSVRTVSASIQILDEESNVIAQSDEIRIEPGKIRYWDFPRETLPGGEPTGRIQARSRILVRTSSFDVNSDPPPLAPVVELIDSSTGRTVSYFTFDPGFVGGINVNVGR
ncbi:MAG TPA: hypothetical protein VIM99_00225 [Blastocatellia bacterium]